MRAGQQAAAAPSKDYSLHLSSNNTLQKGMWTSKRNTQGRGNLTQQQQQQLILIRRPPAVTLFPKSISHIFDRICTSISKPASPLVFFSSYICSELSARDRFRLFFARHAPQTLRLSLWIHSYSRRAFSRVLDVRG